MRSFGVEEEFLLVDARTGNHAPIAGDLPLAAPANPPGAPATRGSAARALRVNDGAPLPVNGGPPVRGRGKTTPGGQQVTSLTAEVQREQVEAVSAPFTDVDELASAIRAGRAEANKQAAVHGARAVALGTSPLATLPHTQSRSRYLAMEERFGLILREQLMCGFHVHVAIASEGEGVAVLDRIRVWLPTLIALSANSPYWQGKDTGYASFRYQVWRRWPTAGPTEIFGSARAYQDLVEMLLSCNVLLDEAMVYFDARLSATYPTVEIRVPDVCLKAGHATAIAAIIRALVETAAQEWVTGKPPSPVPAEMLRLASWRASRFGLDDDLIHPVLNRPRPARDSLDALIEHVAPALQEAGDTGVVHAGLEDILRDGTGARLQRAALAKWGKLRDVMMYAAEMTTNGC
jgi:carboxylate-amine ligase